MIPLERQPVMERIYHPQNPKSSSVLIVLYPLENYFGSILIKRTEDLSIHSGQISFPGGKKDPADQSVVHTALREAEEEIGILPGNIEIVGILSPLYVSPSNFEINPVIGFVDQLQELNPNSEEVEYIIDVPLRNLNSSYTLTDLVVRNQQLKNVPCFMVKGHIVWGATAMILQELLDVLHEL